MRTHPHLWELRGVGVERYQHLVAEFVRKVLEQHLDGVGLGVQRLGAGPLAFVHLVYGIHQAFGGGLDGCSEKSKNQTFVSL